ncbi:MAG: exosome complex protein Rrp42 [Thaumarchaeota archaeon]|nr:exosome complex protein Rrp42 [Nitrososphaerota archaeon]
MSMVKRSAIVDKLRRKRMLELLAEGKRIDGRGPLDYRKLEVEIGAIEKAEGSALVTLGNTKVVAGVKVKVEEPFPDTPDKGILIVNAEVLPVASAYAEPGPPDENAIELSRVTDRGVRASGMVDLSKLVIVEGKWVYSIFVDVSVLNTDGNLFDATSYAVVSALLNAKIPKYVFEDGEVKETGEVMPLPISNVPISVTMASIEDKLVVDPNGEEEGVMDARLTLVVDEEGRLCAGQKGGSGSLRPEKLMEAVEIAINKSKEIRKVIEEAVKVGKA